MDKEERNRSMANIVFRSYIPTVFEDDLVEKCFCNEDLTIAQVSAIFKPKDNKDLDDLVLQWNKKYDGVELYKIFKVDTCLRKAHFFAQSLEEAGINLKPGLQGEDMHYRASALKISDLKFFRDNPALADKYGSVYNDKKKLIQAADPIMIANLAYADKNRALKYRIGNTKEGDGWRFRGRGLLQITGRENYEKQQEIIDNILKANTISIINEDNLSDKAFSMQQAVITGFSDWYHKRLYDIADKGDSDKVVNLVIDKLNKMTSSRKKRVKHYNETTRIVFDLKNCITLNKKGDKK